MYRQRSSQPMMVHLACEIGHFSLCATNVELTEYTFLKLSSQYLETAQVTMRHWLLAGSRTWLSM